MTTSFTKSSLSVAAKEECNVHFEVTDCVWKSRIFSCCLSNDVLINEGPGLTTVAVVYCCLGLILIALSGKYEFCCHVLSQCEHNGAQGNGNHPTTN